MVRTLGDVRACLGDHPIAAANSAKSRHMYKNVHGTYKNYEQLRRGR